MQTGLDDLLQAGGMILLGYTLPFKSSRSVRFLNVLKESSYVHQGCNYLIKI